MANSVGVATLLEQLKAKFGAINADIEQDQFKKAAKERELVGLTDRLEDLNNLLGRQRKLLRQYNNQLDEAEAAIRNLNKQSGKFENSYHKINKSDKNEIKM